MNQYDTVIKNGTIIDGTGLPRFHGDIAIRHGRIAKIGRIDASQAREVIDASGLIVAPGFVDLHTHYDAQVHWDPYCTISGWHGVTSVAIGNCGFGFAPARPEVRERLLRMMTRTEQIPYESMVEGMGLDWDWETLPEWMDHLERIPKGRQPVELRAAQPGAGARDGPRSGQGRAHAQRRRDGRNQRVVHEATDAGMMGWSCQRFGKNSMQADYDGTPMPTDVMPDETLLALADVLADRGEGFIEMINATTGEPLKTNDPKDSKFVEEIARRSGRPVLYNAIIAMDAPGYETAHHAALKWLDECFADGKRIWRPGGHGARRLPVHARALQSLRFEPGLE
ncbi:MAG: amidohydrolase family protein [Proteobacteria bacterium]|nr:amidohydrolase family protein [Pseudomonadota bacterium]